MYSLHTKTLDIDYEKLQRHILVKLNRLKISQRDMGRTLNISRNTLFRLTKRNQIELNTFLKIVLWLNKDVNDYIIECK